MSTSTPTAEQIMQGMKAAFEADKAQGVDAVVQYNLTGNGGGEYYMTIKNGALQVQPGKATNPRMTLTADTQDYYDVVSGKLNPMAAFSSGKLKIGGDMMFAMKLASFFRSPA
ncbi:MAG: SCP2 sterol-binding domain-containing protein [Chloroflexi bacterium]|jgi:putative sterol carrier protein|nr:MAG: SCP2 sterol-binding domain-containing protein [Chloroflexota bacterium]